MRTMSWLAVGAALACASAAHAQNVTADPQRIMDVLREAGYRAELRSDDAVGSYVWTGTSGLDYGLYLYGCDDAGANCKTVMFSAWFEDDTPPTLEDINLYNARSRWGRAYLDSEGAPTIEMDLDLEDGGISPELFIDNVEYWDLALTRFDRFLTSGIVPE